MALVVFGRGLPERFRIGPEWNNYMYKSIYETVVSCSGVNNPAHLPIVCFSTTDGQSGSNQALKQLGKRRARFFECVRGTDKDNAEQVLYLFRVCCRWNAVGGGPCAAPPPKKKARGILQRCRNGHTGVWHCRRRHLDDGRP